MTTLDANTEKLGIRLARLGQVAPADPVREFIRAFNEGDLEAFAEVVDPDVEIHAARGLRKGRDAAITWATRAPGGVQQQIEIEELYESEDRGQAVALIKRLWHWDEDGSPAGEDEMAWAFELRDGRVCSWRSFEDRGEALAAGGFASPSPE
jgi:ketosteroid isomerase-like protein